MSWEFRGVNGPYYTRSKRIRGRIVRDYVGGGCKGLVAAEEDERAREWKRARAQYVQMMCEELSLLDGDVTQVSDLTDVLMTDALQKAGYHNHRGEWRHKHGTDKI